MSVRRSATTALEQTEGQNELLRSMLWYFSDPSQNDFCHNDLSIQQFPAQINYNWKSTQKENNQKRINGICRGFNKFVYWILKMISLFSQFNIAIFFPTSPALTKITYLILINYKGR